MIAAFLIDEINAVTPRDERAWPLLRSRFSDVPEPLPIPPPVVVPASEDLAVSALEEGQASVIIITERLSARGVTVSSNTVRWALNRLRATGRVVREGVHDIASIRAARGRVVWRLA